MTSSTASTNTPAFTPVYFEIAVHDAVLESNKGTESPRVIKIDAYCPTKTEINRRFVRIINPDKEIAGKMSELSGVTNDMVRNRPGFDVIWNEFRQWIAPENEAKKQVILIAHRIYKFTQAILKAECKRCDREFPAEWKSFDTAFLTYCLGDFQSWKDLSLMQICALGNIPFEMSGKTVYEIFSAMTGDIPHEQLYPLMSQPSPIKTTAAAIKAFNKKSKATPFAKESKISLQLGQKFKVAFYDLETTGLLKSNKFDSHPNPRIIEISAYDPERNEYFTRLVNPDMPIPENASNANNIFDHMVEQSPRFNVVWQQFKDWIGPETTILIAHNNYKFDSKVLKLEAERVGSFIPKNWQHFCSLYLTGALKLPKDHKLQTLRQRWGIVSGDAHRAQDDVRVLYEVFRKLIGNADPKLIYQEILTPGPDPVKRVAALIQKAGGPAPFAAAATTIAAPIPTAQQPQIPSFLSKRKETIPHHTFQPISTTTLPSTSAPATTAAPAVAPLASHTLKRRKVQSGVMQAQQDRAIQIAAKLAIELATIFTGEDTVEEEKPAPIPTAQPLLPRRRRQPQTVIQDLGANYRTIPAQINPDAEADTRNNPVPHTDLFAQAQTEAADEGFIPIGAGIADGSSSDEDYADGRIIAKYDSENEIADKPKRRRLRKRSEDEDSTSRTVLMQEID